MSREYHVVRTLGRGGFGVVYLADAPREDGFTKRVAVKVVPHTADQEIVRRLRDEARLLARLHHRNIVDVHDLVHLDQGWAIVMEYVPGIDASRLVKLKPPVGVILEVIEEVANALDAVWFRVSPDSGEQMRILHRDIKAANIRITPDGQVKVLDFGIAHAKFDQRESYTRTGMLPGSFGYIAPERFDGDEGPALDVYSLGVVFGRMLGGAFGKQPPTHHLKHARFINKALAPIEAGGEVSPDELELVRQMLCYDAEGRPAASEVVTRCRSLWRERSDPSLREWATAHLHDAPGACEPEDPSTGSVLIEHTGLTQPTLFMPARPRRGSWLLWAGGSVVTAIAVGAVAIGAASTLALIVMGTGALDWRAPVDPGDVEVSQGAGGQALTDRVDGPTVGEERGGAVVWGESRGGGWEGPLDLEISPDGGDPRREPLVATINPAVERATTSPSRVKGPSKRTPKAVEATPKAVEVTPEAVEVTPEAVEPIRPVTVTIRGDAASVWLRNDQGTVPATEPVAPGTYTVDAWFGSTTPTEAGELVLVAGETVELTCQRATLRCARTELPNKETP